MLLGDLRRAVKDGNLAPLTDEASIILHVNGAEYWLDLCTIEFDPHQQDRGCYALLVAGHPVED